MGAINSGFAKRFVRAAVATAAMLSPFALSGLQAVDLDKALGREVDLSLRSKESIFEIERCVIHSRIRDAPHIYRQPDRPDDTLIFYTAYDIIYGLIQLKADGNGQTDITVRSLSGLQSPRIRAAVTACAAGNVDVAQ